MRTSCRRKVLRATTVPRPRGNATDSIGFNFEPIPLIHCRSGRSQRPGPMLPSSPCGSKVRSFTDRPLLAQVVRRIRRRRHDSYDWRPELNQEQSPLNLASILKNEIVRLSRRSAKQATDSLRATLSTQRKSIAKLRDEVSQLRRELAIVRKAAGKSTRESGQSARYSSKSLRSQRSRLGLSSEHFGKLIGVSAQTIYNLERNPDQRPSQKVISGLASVRQLGRREAADRLAALGVTDLLPKL